MDLYILPPFSRWEPQAHHQMVESEIQMPKKSLQVKPWKALIPLGWGKYKTYGLSPEPTQTDNCTITTTYRKEREESSTMARTQKKYLQLSSSAAHSLIPHNISFAAKLHGRNIAPFIITWWRMCSRWRDGSKNRAAFEDLSKKKCSGWPGSCSLSHHKINGEKTHSFLMSKT